MSLFPVYSFKDGVAFNLFNCGAEARIGHEDSFEEASDKARDAGRKPRLALDHILVYLLGILIVEWSFSEAKSTLS